MQVIGRGVAGGLFGWCAGIAYGDNLPVMVLLIVAYIFTIVIASLA